jgi:hypothetical protein
MYVEKDTTWSSIEKYYNYSKVNWYTEKNGISNFILYDENGDKIDIKIDTFL